MPMSVQQSLAEVWVSSGLIPFGIIIIFITSTTVWPQVKQQGTQPHPSTENWIKDLLNMALNMEQ